MGTDTDTTLTDLNWLSGQRILGAIDAIDALERADAINARDHADALSILSAIYALHQAIYKEIRAYQALERRLKRELPDL